ncbi:hypothetical protein C0966_04465 [Bacillus methanolicus]|uniref:hypothetical protein n=1 Tax=Bacillus methanolicus TaxID=1471 RepID=UPI00237FEF60|nr:hypothetical protein [Bacillus methanolicus]MDE3838642.1 hypothetical protein [Bacillus methanolicus]
MNENNQKTVFTEEEAIKITIEHGYDGAEFQTSVWKQRGCLKNNGTLKALISKLETIYNNVEMIGNGKKRQYILSDKKDKVTERTFNYKGSVATVKDEIMKEYIFNQLTKFNHELKQSYKGWARVLGFCDPDSLSAEEMIETIKELHSGFPVLYNPKEVVSIFIQTLDIRNKDVIEKSFQRLQKEERINVKEVYIFKTIEGEYEEVWLETYQDAEESLRDFLESKDVSYYAYIQSVSSFHKSNKMKEIIKEVEEYLSEQFGIKYFFKSFRVKVLDPTIKKEVTKDEFNQAYFQRLIKLSQNRQNKVDYKQSPIFWKRFYLLNTLTLLDYMNVSGIDELLKEEKKKYSTKTDEYSIDYSIYLFELKEEREKRRHTFGNI